MALRKTPTKASQRGPLYTPSQRKKLKQEMEQVATKQEPVDIHSQALLAKVSISTWTARKYDRKITEEVNRDHKASKDAGRYNKHLFGGNDASKVHAEVIAAAMAIRMIHYEQTLPWADEGWRLLPTANWSAFTDKLRPALARFEQAVKTFIAEYPKLREDARKLLNGMYREEDYPSPGDLVRKFSADVEYQPIPAKGDLRVALPAAKVSEIEQAIEERVNRAVSSALEDAWSRLAGVVEKVRDKLADPEAIFRDSLIGNAGELVDVLSRLNVMKDPKLEEMRKRVASELADLDPKTLRTDKKVRKSAAAKAQQILDAMSSVYGGK